MNRLNYIIWLFLLFLNCIPIHAKNEAKEIAPNVYFSGKVKKNLPTGEGSIVIKDNQKYYVTITGTFTPIENSSVISIKGILNVIQGNLFTTQLGGELDGYFLYDIKDTPKIRVQSGSKLRLKEIKPLSLDNIEIPIEQEYVITPSLYGSNDYITDIDRRELSYANAATITISNCLIKELEKEQGSKKNIYSYDEKTKLLDLNKIIYSDGFIKFEEGETSYNKKVSSFKKEYGNKSIEGEFIRVIPEGWKKSNNNQNFTYNDAAVFKGTLKTNGEIIMEGDFIVPHASGTYFCSVFEDLYKKYKPIFTNITGGKKESFNITCEKGGTLLNYISLDKLLTVDSLTITGILYKADIKVINQMTALQYLDISNTFITYSPEEKKDNYDNQMALSLIGNMLNSALDASYKNGEVSELSYRSNKLLTELMAKDPDIDLQKDVCFVPRISDLPNLSTVKLPYSASSISELGFSNCPKLANIELPLCLEYINRGCFSKCRSLRSIVFPETLKNIYNGTWAGGGEDAFSGCVNLELFDMSKCKNFTQDYTFKIGVLPNLKKVYFPPKMKKIDFYVVGDQSINFYVENPPVELLITSGGSEKRRCSIHFAASIAPKECHISEKAVRNIYIPKGSLASYYDKLGDNFNYIEE